MKKTDNYSLPQWEKQDFIKMEDFNDAFGKTGTGRSGSVSNSSFRVSSTLPRTNSLS